MGGSSGSVSIPDRPMNSSYYPHKSMESTLQKIDHEVSGICEDNFLFLTVLFRLRYPGP